MLSDIPNLTSGLMKVHRYINTYLYMKSCISTVQIVVIKACKGGDVHNFKAGFLQTSDARAV